MSAQIEIVREATPEVVDAVAELVAQLSPNAAAPDHAAVAVAAIVASPASTLFVARVEGRIVGTLTLILAPQLTGFFASIEDVVVDADARGHGAGRALVDAALDVAKAAGAGKVGLTSRSSREAANRLYQRAGFELRETNVYRFTFE